MGFKISYGAEKQPKLRRGTWGWEGNSYSVFHHRIWSDVGVMMYTCHKSILRFFLIWRPSTTNSLQFIQVFNNTFYTVRILYNSAHNYTSYNYFCYLSLSPSFRLPHRILLTPVSYVNSLHNLYRIVMRPSLIKLGLTTGHEQISRSSCNVRVSGGSDRQ